MVPMIYTCLQLAHCMLGCCNGGDMPSAGGTLVRLKREIHKKLKALAAKEKRNMGQQIEVMYDAYSKAKAGK